MFNWSVLRVVIFAGIAGACSSVTHTVEPSSVETDTTSVHASKSDFDPLVVTEDPWVIQYRVQSASSSIPSDGWAEPASGNSAEVTVIGYRVQLFSTTDYHAALDFRDRAGAVLSESVYLDYEQPYYKVRVGNYPDRDLAETAKLAARDFGYKDAWVVRTRILIKN